jgi:hypothetical protein
MLNVDGEIFFMMFCSFLLFSREFGLSGARPQRSPGDRWRLPEEIGAPIVAKSILPLACDCLSSFDDRLLTGWLAGSALEVWSLSARA